MVGRGLQDAAVVQLRAAGCVFAEDEVTLLAADALDDTRFQALVDRRATGVPLEQVIGHVDFEGVRIELRPAVFVPRARSALLARSAALAAGQRESPIVVDLCCGSGALGAAVAHRVQLGALHAADVDPNAVACARLNLARFGGQAHEGSLFAALPGSLQRRVDVLIANVPYVPTGDLHLMPAEARLWEPRAALDGGADGLDVLRAVAGSAASWLAPGGVMLSELMTSQVDTAREIVRAAGLDAEIAIDPELEATIVLGRPR